MDASFETWETVNPPESYARNDPYLHEFTCEIFPADSVGLPFKFRVIASSTNGVVYSDVSAVMYLAGVPKKPASSPTSDADVTSGTMIKVDYAGVSEDGGLPVLSYEL
jgi:hypothetical protein